MKKYGMIFASAIFTLLIMFVPNKEVNAINLNGIEIEPPVDITTNAFIIATNTSYKDNSNKLYEYVAISYESFDYLGFYYNASHDSLYIRPADNSQWLSASHWLYDGSKWILLNVNSGAWYMYLDNIFYSNIDIIQYNTQEIVYIADSLPSNEFNEIIMTDVYSKVEFEFELPLSTKICTKDEWIDGVLTNVDYICPTLDLNYNVFNSDVNGNLNTMTFSIPYIEKKYLYDTGNSSITKTDILSLSDKMSNIYEGNYIIEHDSSITKLKLVIDLFGLDYSYVNVQFSSNIPYSVIYYDKEVESEYIDSVDITGKAGVMFIPKQIDNDMLSSFSFYPSMYSIQLRDSYKNNYKVLSYYSVGYCDYRDYKDDIPYICNEVSSYNISVKFAKGNLEQSLFIINRDYPQNNKSIIYYDTRHFHYVIYNTLADTPTFIHPITGEESIANSLIDFDSSITEQESFFEMFKSGFNRFKGVIIDIFQNINYFFVNLSIELQYFYIVVFSIILFIFLIRFLL